MAKASKQSQLLRRRRRTRARVFGTLARPRLSVRRSLKHVYAQLINDEAGKTLVSANDLSLAKVKEGGKVARAMAVGVLLAERAKTAGITAVVFDRGGRAFHGRVKQVALGAREAGLEV